MGDRSKAEQLAAIEAVAASTGLIGGWRTELFESEQNRSNAVTVHSTHLCLSFHSGVPPG